MAPKFDENGEEFKFSEMRLLMMEMDRFTVNCEFQLVWILLKFVDNTIHFIIAVHPGENVIKRKSSESAVTIPYSQTFRNIDKERPGGPLDQPGGQLQQTSRESYEFDFCGKQNIWFCF